MNTRRFSTGWAIACGLTLVAGLMGLALGAGVLPAKKPGIPPAEICKAARS